MGLLDWVDPAREWWKSRPEVARGLLGAAYQMATDPQAREAAMARYPVFDRSQSGQQMIDNAMNAGPSGLLGKIVYHGSPHKFDKFDASKIGTGEGAQAYGHGVYLADAPDVAKSYVDPLYKARDATQIGGLPYDDFLNKSRETVPTSTRDRALFSKALAPAKSQEEAAANLAELKKLRPEYDFQKVDALFSLAFKSGVSFPQKGALYKADLPDEWIPKMLDYDLPINKQHAAVQDWARTMLKEKGYLRPNDNGPRQLASSWDAFMMEHGGMIKPKGGQGIYEEMAKSFGSPDAASNYLREAGIPGIRYLDGNSRNGGRKSYNYVVFPGLEDKVKILERDGVPLTGLLGR